MIFIWILRIFVALYAAAVLAFVMYMIPLIIVDRKWVKAYELAASYNYWVIYTKQHKDLLLSIDELPPCYKAPIHRVLFRSYLNLFDDPDVCNSLRIYRSSTDYKPLREWKRIFDKTET